MNILLIDDEPWLFKDILLAYNYGVDVALNGYQGLRLLHSEGKSYDLVILDIQMPILDGWEILKLIRNDKNLADVFVMLLTSNSMEESTIRGLNRGADRYVTKPISPELFLAHIKAFERRLSQKTSTPEPKPLAALELLTARENQILKLVVKGLSNRQIAEQLVISETTVKNHLAKIFQKLKVENRTQAAFFLQKYSLATQ